ncbi:hypothetical protein KSS87_013025, partial [Heliosperma pusillum]
MDEKFKKLVKVSVIDTGKHNESTSMGVMKIQSNIGSEIKDTEVVKMESSVAERSCVMELNTNSKKDEKFSKKSVLEFSRKGGGNSRLRIP